MAAASVPDISAILHSLRLEPVRSRKFMRYFTLFTKYAHGGRLAQGKYEGSRMIAGEAISQNVSGAEVLTAMHPESAARRKQGSPIGLSCSPSVRHSRLLVLVAIAAAIHALAAVVSAQQAQPTFKVAALAERGGIHKPFVDAAKAWLAKEAVADGFTVDYIENTDKIDDKFLSQYKLFIQLNYPPYAWNQTAMAAFQRYIDEGRGGWIGFHHATLLGEFDGYPMWPWFSNFMGGIRFTQYIPTFVTGTVSVESPRHPAMTGLPTHFTIENEEWYTYDKSPRPNVRVLASVDESTYSPSSSIKMGDHPVVWTNEHVKARNVYIFMGHHGELFQNSAFTTLFHNAILWAAKP
jgi:type 1 glutamine amidotransferase